MSRYVVNSVGSDASISKVGGVEIESQTRPIGRRCEFRAAQQGNLRLSGGAYRRVDERAGNERGRKITDGWRAASLGTLLKNGLLPDRPSAAHLSLGRAGGRSESGNI